VWFNVLLAKIAHHLRNHCLIFGRYGSFHKKIWVGRVRIRAGRYQSKTGFL
jgi:ribosomal protein S14